MSKYVPKLKRNSTIPNHKWCTQCYTEKPYEAFKLNPKVKCGRHSWCIQCETRLDLERQNRKYRDNHCKREVIKNRHLASAFLKSALIDRLLNKNSLKPHKTIGCTKEEFLKYLESKMKPGMNWENYGGKTGWVLDHIFPLSKAFEKGIDFFKESCKYNNIQPLWALENLIKSNKIL